jgi:Xaa-Pro aminopeptidase
MSWSVGEYQTKLQRVRQHIDQEQLDFLLLTSQTNLRWLTGGRTYVNQAAEKACVDLLIGKDKVYLISNNIEVNRLLTEEMPGLGIGAATYGWWEDRGFEKALSGIVEDKRMLTDVQLGNKFSRLRWDLTVEEQARYYDAGAAVAAVLETIAFTIKPGMSEQAMAEMIKHEAIEAGVNPWITLVAADDRAFHYRHPVPTANKLVRYAMLCLTGEQHGLYVSATRLVHFGPVPGDLVNRHQGVLAVDACFIGATLPAASAAEAFTKAMRTYQQCGYPQEWQHHHQGGMIGYTPREFRATEHTHVQICQGHAYAWNPTIAGVKSEDTILVCDNQAKIVSKCRRFPTVAVEYPGGVINRPAILVI